MTTTADAPAAGLVTDDGRHRAVQSVHRLADDTEVFQWRWEAIGVPGATRVPPAAIYAVQHREALRATPIPHDIFAVQLAGYAAGGDGGAARFRVADDGEAHIGRVRSADGRFWEIDEGVVTPEMFGVTPGPDASILSLCDEILQRYRYLKIPYREGGINLEGANEDGTPEGIRLLGNRVLDFDGNLVRVNGELYPTWVMSGDDNRVCGHPHYLYTGNYVFGVTPNVDEDLFYAYMQIAAEDRSLALGGVSLGAVGVTVGPNDRSVIESASFDTISLDDNKCFRVYRLFGGGAGIYARSTRIGYTTARGPHAVVIAAEQDGLLIEGIDCVNRTHIDGAPQGHVVYATSGPTYATRNRNCVIGPIKDRDVHGVGGGGTSVSLKNMEHGVIGPIESEHHMGVSTIGGTDLHIFGQQRVPAIDFGATPVATSFCAKVSGSAENGSADNVRLDWNVTIAGDAYPFQALITDTQSQDLDIRMKIRSPARTGVAATPQTLLRCWAKNSDYRIDWQPTNYIDAVDDPVDFAHVLVGAIDVRADLRLLGPNALGHTRGVTVNEPSARVTLAVPDKGDVVSRRGGTYTLGPLDYGRRISFDANVTLPVVPASDVDRCVDLWAYAAADLLPAANVTMIGTDGATLTEINFADNDVASAVVAASDGTTTTWRVTP